MRLFGTADDEERRRGIRAAIAGLVRFTSLYCALLLRSEILNVSGGGAQFHTSPWLESGGVRNHIDGAAASIGYAAPHLP